MENLRSSFITGHFLHVLSAVLLMIGVTVTACKSPAGDVGAQGPEGPEGPIGPAGDDGSMMYAGAGEPADDIGNIGDYYLNQETGELHGPKDSDGWGNPIIVLMGDDGKDGSQIYSGDEAPDDTLGVIGDFYIDTVNQDLYGPKTTNRWGDSINLNGQDGTDGEDGSQIHAGDGPPDASVGVVGDYYMDQTNKDLYGPKTDNGWGSPVDLNGEDGVDGQDGVDGKDGSQIYSGTGAPDDFLTGGIGDYYLDKTSYDLYGPKTILGWGTPLNLRGADGNANVTRYVFSSYNFDGSLPATKLIEVDSTQVEESSWNVYLKYDNRFYHIPGYGRNTSTQYYVSHEWHDGSVVGEGLYFEIGTVNTSVGEYYSNIYIIQIRAADTVYKSKQGGSEIPAHLDLSDYNAVADYYNFYK